jgi:hypothetical protein
MQVAIAFVTKYPHENILKFAKEVSSVGFDTFVISDDNCKNENVININDDICESSGYKNAHIWENSPSIKKQITSWDKMLYLFCEIETTYDFVWVFEDDCFIPSVETIQHLHLKYRNYHLVTPNNLKNDGSMMDWHWRYIYDKCKNGPYAYSMVSACGLSRDILNEVKRFKEQENQLFFIEAMFNTLALQKGLKVIDAFELKSIVWQGNWGINEFMLLENNIFHPRKDIENHYALRSMIKEYKLKEYKPKDNLPHFLKK